MGGSKSEKLNRDKDFPIVKKCQFMVTVYSSLKNLEESRSTGHVLGKRA